MSAPYNVCNGNQAAGSSTFQLTVGTGSGTPTGTSKGDAIVVVCSGVSNAPVSCTDSQGNFYVLKVSDSGTTQTGAIFVSTSNDSGGTKPTVPLVPGTDWVKVTYTTTTNALNMVVRGRSNVTVGAGLADQSAHAHNASGTAASSGATLTLSSSTEWAIGAIVNSSAGGTPSALSFGTGLTVGASSQLTAFDETVNATAGVTASGTLAASAIWAAMVVTIPLVTQFPLTFGFEPNEPVVTASPIWPMAFCFSVTGGSGNSGTVNFPLTFGFQANQSGYNVVNTWTDTAQGNYGMRSIPIANNSGNTLVAFVGWNGATVSPVAYVSDDAHNWWVPAGVSSSSGDCRCAVWVCTNAQAAQNLSLGMSWFTQSVCTVIAELAPGVAWTDIDFTVTQFSNSTTLLQLPYTTTQPDILLAAVCQSDNAVPVTLSGNGFSPIASAAVNDPSGAGGPADCTVGAYWRTRGSGQTATPGWAASSAIPLSGVLVGISQSPPNPVQKNPNWPVLHYEMAFGYQPGDPTQMPVWTDVTSRVMGGSGESVIKSSRGKQYESASPEAGDLTIQLNNQDGAFNPANTSSPYWPNVLQGTPVRVWAQWQGRSYPVAYGYTERAPQTFPMPQWGVVSWEAPDGLDPLANSVLPSAFAGELLADEPYGLWPFSDTYLQGGADGLPLANLARTNQRPMICMDAWYQNSSGAILPRFLQTGLAWSQATVGQVAKYTASGAQGSGLPGDPSSAAIGATDFVGGKATPRGPGAFYTAPDLPQPGTTGMTIEFWAMIPGISAGSHYQELLRMSGPVGNYYVGPGGGTSNAYARGTRFLVRVNPGPPGTQGQDWVYIDFGDYEGNDFSTGVQGKITNNQPHHFAFAITESLGGGSNYKLQFWLDGQLQSTTFSTGVNVENDWDYIGVGGVMHNDGGFSFAYNYTLGHVALYPAPLTNARIQAHYNAAWTGAANDDVVGRIAKLMVWGGFGMPRSSGPTSPVPLLGPADQVSGQSVVDAASSVAQADNGLLFVDGAGNFTYWPRQFLMNKPVKWTLGDGPGEIPYQSNEAYDYDNQFVANSVQVQRQISSAANGVLVTVADQTSEKQYFTRSGISNTVETVSDEDAYDQANWLLQKYKQPKLRVQQVVIDPASNPSAWKFALGCEQGDIVQLNRRPLGAAVYSQTYIIQMISHDGGPDHWNTTVNMIPYDIEGAVLQCDAAGFDSVASNGLGW